jgi:hypothetical protein
MIQIPVKSGETRKASLWSFTEVELDMSCRVRGADGEEENVQCLTSVIGSNTAAGCPITSLACGIVLVPCRDWREKDCNIGAFIVIACGNAERA